MDYTEMLTAIIVNVVSTAITAIIGFIFAKKYLNKLNFSNKMEEFGFLNTSTKKLSKRELQDIFGNATKVKILFVSGYHFLNMNEKLMKEALKKGTTIQFLCAGDNPDFLKDIERMENVTKDSDGNVLRNKEDKILTEIDDISHKYKETGLQIRHFSTEYRMPYVLAYYKDETVKAWLTMTLPPYKSTKSFTLRGSKLGKEVYDDSFNFVDMMEMNFDTIWKKSKENITISS